MILQKETALYDEGKIQNAVNDAKTKATGYMTNVSNDGVFVHEYDVSGQQPTDTGANGVHISDDVDIVRNGEVVASYGSSATIGSTASGKYNINVDGANGIVFKKGSNTIGGIDSSSTAMNMYVNGVNSGDTIKGTVSISKDVTAVRSMNVTDSTGSQIWLEPSGDMTFKGTIGMDAPGDTFVLEAHTFETPAITDGSSAVVGGVPAYKSGYYPLCIVGYATGNYKRLLSRIRLTNRTKGEATIAYTAHAVDGNVSADTMTVDILWIKDTGSYA